MKNSPIKTFAYLLLGVAASVSAPASASAYTCTGYISSTYTTVCENASTTGSLQSSTRASANLVAARITVAKSSKSGGNGGNWFEGVDFWANGAHASVENDHATIKYDGSMMSGLVGADGMFNDNMLFGLAGGYETIALDTTYNTGKVDAMGWTIIPYISYIMDDNYSVDLLGGYSIITYDKISRTDGTVYTGDTSATRFFGRGVFNWHMSQDEWRYHLSAGITYITEDRDGYTDTDGTNTVLQPKVTTDSGRVDAGGTLGYRYQQLEPYAIAYLLWDFEQEDVAVATSAPKPTNDKIAAEFGAGVRFYISDSATAYLQATTEQFRSDFSLFTISGQIRATF